jgi:hypothetical protein
MALKSESSLQPTKRKPRSTASESSKRLSSLPSPELLLTIQQLQEEINELKSQRGMTAEEKAELAQLKQGLAEAKAEATGSNRVAPPSSTRPKRLVNYGIFTVEEHEE